MKPWLKAGLIGGAVQVLFTLPVSLIFVMPLGIGMAFVLCLSCLFLLSLPLPGILAAHWLPEPRTIGQGALVGTWAGLVAGAIDSIFTLVITYIFVVTGLYDSYMNKILPGAGAILHQGQQAFFFSTAGIMLQMAISLVFSVIFAVAISVVAGLLYVVIRKK
jgi:hypothetical protein